MAEQNPNSWFVSKEGNREDIVSAINNSDAPKVVKDFALEASNFYTADTQLMLNSSGTTQAEDVESIAECSFFLKTTTYKTPTEDNPSPNSAKEAAEGGVTAKKAATKTEDHKEKEDFSKKENDLHKKEDDSHKKEDEAKNRGR
jgi:hypothetical protein